MQRKKDAKGRDIESWTMFSLAKGEKMDMPNMVTSKVRTVDADTKILQKVIGVLAYLWIKVEIVWLESMKSFIRGIIKAGSEIMYTVNIIIET